MDCQATSVHSPIQVCTVDEARARRSMVANTTSDPRNGIEQHLAAMRAFALVLAGNREFADDIVSLTVIEAWAGIKAADTGSGLRPRLFRMLRDTYHAKRCQPQEGVVQSVVAKVTEPAEPDDAVSGFRRIFDTLPDEQREALILVVAQAFSFDDAGKVCGCSSATIKSRVTLGRRTLVASASQVQVASGTAVLPVRLDREHDQSLPWSQGAQNRMAPIFGTRSARSLTPASGEIGATSSVRTGPRLVPAPDYPNAADYPYEGDYPC
ncbi:sigma factor-like helix-turn-helix DNA-binding protein [Citreimonas salinaria]|uniref:DNA-directed RNA polymerase specialized sigma subunit, sigma24 family n=1 Tax=Citreimonas salinaria TaxID=321339 RepID=A0A1H3NUL2_9RHOB|nr:sigma factor-like helix-turn-helix DNA-binding protein [Citreimonas salinaria]SDY91849.1 DNA-directed RNA polymerase specialized sigma subunit, sigma24 family [Citreimonas salinaria]